MCMFKSVYIDIIFVELYDEIMKAPGTWYHVFQSNDRSAMSSFYSTLSSNGSLTESQANYIIRLLTKYRVSLTTIFDYTSCLKNPQWSQPFRTIDLTRKIWVESENKKITLILKFPFSVKEAFDAHIISSEDNRIRSEWDPERRVRSLNPYDINLLKLNCWLEEHDFELDESYENFMASVEEIINSEEHIIPYSEVRDNVVYLVNAGTSALEYFESNKTGYVNNDLLLAKSMGFIFKGKLDSTLEKICGSESTRFHISHLEKAFSLSESVKGTKVIILDRADNYTTWMKKLYNFLVNQNIDTNKFVFCHRENKTNDSGFNEWIKDCGFGGKTEDAEYLIFVHKPKKWLFSNNIDVKIVFTTGLWDTRDVIARAFLQSNGCDISISESVPTNSFPHPEYHMLGGTKQRVEL